MFCNREVRMPAQTIIHRLSCGIPLLIRRNHEVAVATVDAWVRTGAADEPPEVAGVSHFLEHMLFKGTEHRGLGQIEREIENVGGVCNAGTSYDFTHYYVTLPSASMGVGVDVIADIMRRATLDPGELERERMVILEEYRRKQDHPVGILGERLYEEIFERGPYHESVIGTEQTIAAIDRERMLEYYRKRYTPHSITLVVTGDVQPRQVLDQAERAFAGFDRPVVQMRPDPELSYGLGKRVYVPHPTGGEVYVAFAFGSPGMNRPDAVLPLDIAQSILGQGRASRLFQSLKEKQGLCSMISTYFPTHLRDSLFAVIATCPPDKREPLRRAFIAELEAFAGALPETQQFNRAFRVLESDHLFAMETSTEAASLLGYYYTMTGSTEFIDRYIDRLGAVTPEQMCQVFTNSIRPGQIEAQVTEVAVGPNGSSG